jgi:hypothetical protein
MPRRHWIGAALLPLAAALAACGSGGGVPEFSTTLPAATTGADAVPISLIDQVGIVTGIAVAPGRPPASPSTVEVSPDRPDALRVSWLTGECDDRVTMVLNDVGGAYQLTIHNHPQVTAGLLCTAAGIARSVDIGFNQRLDPGRLELNIQFP